MDGPMDIAVEGRPKGKITKGPLQYFMLKSLQCQLVERRELLKSFVQGSDWKRFPSPPEKSGCWWKDGVARRIWKQHGDRQGEAALLVFSKREVWPCVKVMEGGKGDLGRSLTGKSAGLVRLLALPTVSTF